MGAFVGKLWSGELRNFEWFKLCLHCKGRADCLLQHCLLHDVVNNCALSCTCMAAMLGCLATATVCSVTLRTSFVCPDDSGSHLMTWRNSVGRLLRGDLVARACDGILARGGNSV